MSRHYSYIDPTVGIGSQILADQNANGSQYGVRNSVDIVARNITATGNFVGEIAASGSTFINLAVTGIATIGIVTGTTSMEVGDLYATTLYGDGSGITGVAVSTVNGDLDVTGNLSVGGTITYEDVTNVDSIGVITARSGIDVTSGVITARSGIDVTSGDIAVESGFIGVGTVAPNNAELHLTSSNNQTKFRFQNTGTGGNSWYFQSSANTAGNGQGAFSIYNGNAGSYPFQITADNKVGINSINPQQELDVAGNFQLAGKIIAGDSINHPNVTNTLNKSASGGANAFRPINLIDTSALIKISRVDSSSGAGLDLQQWDDTLTTLISRSIVTAAAGDLNFKNQIQGGNISFLGYPTGGSSNTTLATINSDGDASFTGIVTASSFSGDGSNLTNVSAGSIDGIQVSSFLRSDAADSYSGGQLDIKSNSTTGHYQGWGVYYGGSWKHTNSNSYGYAFRNNGTSMSIKVSKEAGTANGAANFYDYTFSGGTDAELLIDHTNSQQSYNQQHNVNAPFYNTFSQSGSQYQAIVKGRSTGSSQTFIGSFGVLHSSSGNHNIVIHSILGDGTGSAAYSFSGSTGTVWTSGNDGTGSGLDADTLDGIQGSNFLRSNANDEATGQITLSGGVSTSGKDVYTNSGAFISNDSEGAFADRGGSNIDHFWHNDTDNAWIFNSDTTYKNNTGTANIKCAAVNATGNATIGGQVTLGSELNLIGSSDANKYMDCRIGTNSFHIRKTTGGDSGHEVMARFTGDAGVDLYYNNSVKLTTTSTGATVTGDITPSGAFLGFNDTNGQSPNNAPGAETRHRTQFGRATGQYFTHHGSASGNFMCSVSSSGNPKTNFYLTNSVDGGANVANAYTFGDGSFTAPGNVTAYSDIKLKENIEVIPNALDKVCQIRGVTYDRIDKDYERQSGVIAQEVEKVLPEVVSYDENQDVKTVAYGNMVGLLIESIKELKSEIDDLKQEIKELKG